MKEIKVFFSDGSVRIFHEEQTFMTLNVFPLQESPSESYMGQSKMYGLWNHTHDGLVPSFLELLSNSTFFFDVENPDVYYNSSSVVRVEK